MYQSRSLFLLSLMLVCVTVAFMSFLPVNSLANYHMYPQCGSDVYSAKIKGQGSTTIYTFPDKMTELTFTCLSHVVNSSSAMGPDEAAEDVCYNTRYSPLPYSFLLRITHTDKKGNSKIHHHNITISDSGSVASLTYQTSEPSTFELVFENEAKKSECELNIRVMFTYNSSTATREDTSAPLIPVLAGMKPSLLHLNGKETYLGFYHDENDRSRDWKSDVVTLIDYTSTCESPSGVQTLTNVSTISYLVPAHSDDRDHVCTYKHTFTNEGFYRLCYRRGNEKIAHQTAILHIFSSNPTHYEISLNENSKHNNNDNDNNNSDNDSNTSSKTTGRVIVDDEATIGFYGYDMWAGQYKDDYAFVAADGDCATGRRAAEEFNYLRPDMCPGNSCKFTYTSFLITSTGVFKVCYYHSINRKWFTVPSFNDIGPGTLPNLSHINTTIPTPIDPVTHEECEMASPSTSVNP